MSVKEAMREDAPLLHEDLYTNSMGEMSPKPSNIAARMRFETGDIEKGFAEAEVVVEREFETASVHQGYIEPQNATAF